MKVEPCAGLAAMLGGICWAFPAVVHLAQVLAGEARPTYWAWHPLHAVAGVAFAVALVTWSRRRARSRGSRIGLWGATAGAALFCVANTGEALTGLEVFVPLYGLGLLALSSGLLVAGLAWLRARSAPASGWVLTLLGAFPLTFAAQALPSPLAEVTTDLAWLLYGAGWAWLGRLPGRVDHATSETCSRRS